MLLAYFTEEAYDNLLQNIPQNAEYYTGDTDDETWLSSYFKGKGEYYKNSTVDVNKFSPAFNKEKRNLDKKTRDAKIAEEDLVNTRLLYEAFKKLTPLQASNKYMWTYLCHAIPEYREYIQDRWMQKEEETTIKTRFFVTTPGSLLNDNALSRLWWYGHLTYDKNNSNPYALTEILFTNQTICTDVMDTLNRRNYNRIRGLLLAIKDFKEKLFDNKHSDRPLSEYVRDCNKYLNRYAAVTTLEYLESEEIRKLAFDYMMKLREEDNKKR